MTTTVFKHVKCGGVVVMDISQRFSFSTPSFSLTMDGISLGTMEISEKKDCTEPTLKCQKCGSFINPEEEKTVSSQCMFCRKHRPIASLWVSHPFYSVCESCKDILTGEKEAESEELVETMSFFLVPKDSIRFIPMSEIFKKPIK